MEDDETKAKSDTSCVFYDNFAIQSNTVKGMNFEKSSKGDVSFFSVSEMS